MPVRRAALREWDGWRFSKAGSTWTAVALSSTRGSARTSWTSDNDITRAERQQQVTQAIADKLVGVGTFLRMPFNGDELLRLASPPTCREPAAPARLGEVPVDDGSTIAAGSAVTRRRSAARP